MAATTDMPVRKEGWRDWQAWPLRLPRLGFRTQMIGLVGALVVLMLEIQGMYLNHRYESLMENQIGVRALNVAKILAVSREMVSAFETSDPALLIQPIATAARLQTGATFVVVGNREGIRYAHPLDDRIGQRMVGEDNAPAVERGEAYVSQATGSMGASIRGKAPILDANNQVIGLVSVGFLVDEVEQRVAHELSLNRALMLLIAALGITGAVLISARFKRAILGLEPHEIARRLEEKDAILQSIHEGMIAINRDGQVSLINHAARRLLPPEKLSEDPTGRHIQDILPTTRLHEVVRNGEAQYNQEIWIGQQLMVVNRVPIVVDGRVEGAVATFRSRMEILALSRSLLEVRQLADGLRSQAHEFSNKLHTIAGLLQLDQAREALALISQETEVDQERIAMLQDQVQDPVLCGMLVGKLIRATGRGIQIEVDGSSSMGVILSSTASEALVSIVGNLLDNASEAPRAAGVPVRVRLFFTDMGDDLVFEVDDNGQGVSTALGPLVFDSGVSTKGTGRGIGLALVRHLCRQFEGDVTVEDSELGGACFVAVVKKGRMREALDHV